VVRITQPGERQVDTPDFTSRISPARQMSLAFIARDLNQKWHEIRLQQKAPQPVFLAIDEISRSLIQKWRTYKFSTTLAYVSSHGLKGTNRRFRRLKFIRTLFCPKDTTAGTELLYLKVPRNRLLVLLVTAACRWRPVSNNGGMVLPEKRRTTLTVACPSATSPTTKSHTV
jgi:hypothetical protein